MVYKEINGITMKLCSKCSEWKPLDEYRNRSPKSGRADEKGHNVEYVNINKANHHELNGIKQI